MNPKIKGALAVLYTLCHITATKDASSQPSRKQDKLNRSGVYVPLAPCYFLIRMFHAFNVFAHPGGSNSHYGLGQPEG